MTARKAPPLADRTVARRAAFHSLLLGLLVSACTNIGKDAAENPERKYVSNLIEISLDGTILENLKLIQNIPNGYLIKFLERPDLLGYSIRHNRDLLRGQIYLYFDLENGNRRSPEKPADIAIALGISPTLSLRKDDLPLIHNLFGDRVAITPAPAQGSARYSSPTAFSYKMTNRSVLLLFSDLSILLHVNVDRTRPDRS
jgi:hypothetical protein